MERKEKFAIYFQDRFKTERPFNWSTMQEAGIIFETLCIPGKDTMPDSPIMMEEDMGVESAMWAFIISVNDQAEQEGKHLHHDYADAYLVSILGAASVLEDKTDELAIQNEIFKTLFGMTPTEFVEEFY